jgi:uncharacterized protein YaeQ
VERKIIHLQLGNPDCKRVNTACGKAVPHSQVTNGPRYVTCKTCKHTEAMGHIRKASIEY